MDKWVLEHDKELNTMTWFKYQNQVSKLGCTVCKGFADNIRGSNLVHPAPGVCLIGMIGSMTVQIQIITVSLILAIQTVTVTLDLKKTKTSMLNIIIIYMSLFFYT